GGAGRAVVEQPEARGTRGCDRAAGGEAARGHSQSTEELTSREQSGALAARRRRIAAGRQPGPTKAPRAHRCRPVRTPDQAITVTTPVTTPVPTSSKVAQRRPAPWPRAVGVVGRERLSTRHTRCCRNRARTCTAR